MAAHVDYYPFGPSWPATTSPLTTRSTEPPSHPTTQPPAPLRVQMYVEQATKFHEDAGGGGSAL